MRLSTFFITGLTSDPLHMAFPSPASDLLAISTHDEPISETHFSGWALIGWLSHVLDWLLECWHDRCKYHVERLGRQTQANGIRYSYWSNQWFETPKSSFTTTDEHTQTSVSACVPSNAHMGTNKQTCSQITPTPQSPILWPSAYQISCLQTSLQWSVLIRDCLCTLFSPTCHICQMKTFSNWPSSNLS